MHKICCPRIAVSFRHLQVAPLLMIPTFDSQDIPLTISHKMAACTFYRNALRLHKDDTKSPNDQKFQYNEENNILLMPVLQKTSIRFFKRFPTAMHSDEMYILHLFRHGQWSIFISTLYKAVGPYSIPIKSVKASTKNVMAKPLEILFNTSFSTGIVPEKVELAKVLPVFKKGHHSNLNNYRPISLLSVFNKLLEKLMYNRLIAYLQKKNVLYDKQFGFRSQNSTEHAILTITDKIQKAIENRNYSCEIFLDFSKAFDTAHHGILINKLEKYGIRGFANDWFASYLTGRKHFVSLNNISSDLNDINCGIPQGSVLGPLLFLLYINDFYKCSELFDFHHFADDSNLFYVP